MSDDVFMSIPINKTGNLGCLNLLHEPVDKIIVVDVDWVNATPSYNLSQRRLIVDVFPKEDDEDSVRFFGGYPYYVLVIPEGGWINVSPKVVDYWCNWWVLKFPRGSVTSLYLRKGFFLTPKNCLTPSQRVFLYDVDDVEFNVSEALRLNKKIALEKTRVDGDLKLKEQKNTLRDKYETEVKEKKKEKALNNLGMGGGDYG